MKKRNIMLGSAIMLAVLLVAGGTMAWFTAEADEVVNNFTAGTVAITINDEFDEIAAQNVNPGDTYAKEVSITNDGTKRAYIRVELVAAFDGNQPVEVAEYLDPLLLENWVLDGGWYYYKEIVDPTEVTANIIEEVLFNGAGMDNTYQGAEFTLTVNAEAIQATNGAINDAWTVDPAALGLEVLPVVEP